MSTFTVGFTNISLSNILLASFLVYLQHTFNSHFAKQCDEAAVYQCAYVICCRLLDSMKGRSTSSV